MEEIFSSSVRENGDLAGVFEFDGETSYFYLYKTDEKENNKIIDSMIISSGDVDYCEDDVDISWSANQDILYLTISGRLYAVFDCTSGKKYVGDYRLKASPDLPENIILEK